MKLRLSSGRERSKTFVVGEAPQDTHCSDFSFEGAEKPNRVIRLLCVPVFDSHSVGTEVRSLSHSSQLSQLALSSLFPVSSDRRQSKKAGDMMKNDTERGHERSPCGGMAGISGPLTEQTLPGECNRPLGMNSRSIKDDQITASSSFDLEHTGPQNARFRLHTGGGAWCPQNQINSTTKEWLQISFSQEMTITAIATEGRFDEGRGQEYPTAYRIEYWRSSLHGWAAYKNDQGNEIIPGNVDTRSEELRNLDGAIVARRIRVIPVSNSTRTVCMRLELYGCPYKGILESYSVPEGTTADGLSFLDFSYDGAKKDDMLEGGLGKLYDGLVGQKNFEHQPGKWIGWRSHKNTGEYVTLTFNFFENQNLSAISVHTNNIPSQLAPSFSSAIMAFSYDGITFSRREIYFNYPPDSFETARWVRIPIPDRVAKVLELKLFFGPQASWLLISEVKFETNQITFQIPEDFQEDITFHHFLEDDNHQPSGLLGTVVMLTVIFSICGGIFCCIHIMLKKRDRVKAASPPPNYANRPRDMKVCLENGTIRHVTQSTYQMAVDNMKNHMMEKCPLEAASDYAEPDVIGTDSAMIPLLSSFNNYGCEYASSSTGSPFISCPLSPAAKYSDYGEVYATILPEIERSKLEFIEKIGHGEFGEVHLCKLESRLVAVKRMHGGTPDEEYSFQREIRVLGSLKHPNVVEVIGVSINEKPLLCIMEYMKNGDLKGYLSRSENIDTSLCMSICTQLAAGLAYLESCNFVHRDLAARNCLVDTEGNVKISDFGMSRSLYSNDYYRVEGRTLLPIRWMAPESLLMGKFSTSSDVWAFGVTMWEVFSRCQQKPYANLTDEQVVLNLQQADSHLHTLLPRPPLCPYSVYNQILINCWRSNPASRTTSEHNHLQLQSMIHSAPSQA